MNIIKEIFSRVGTWVGALVLCDCSQDPPQDPPQDAQTGHGYMMPSTSTNPNDDEPESKAAEEMIILVIEGNSEKYGNTRSPQASSQSKRTPLSKAIPEGPARLAIEAFLTTSENCQLASNIPRYIQDIQLEYYSLLWLSFITWEVEPSFHPSTAIPSFNQLRQESRQHFTEIFNGDEVGDAVSKKVFDQYKALELDEGLTEQDFERKLGQLLDKLSDDFKSFCT